MTEEINDESVDSEDEDEFYSYEIPAAVVFALGALTGVGCVYVYGKAKTFVKNKVESGKLKYATRKIKKELDTEK